MDKIVALGKRGSEGGAPVLAGPFVGIGAFRPKCAGRTAGLEDEILANRHECRQGQGLGRRDLGEVGTNAHGFPCDVRLSRVRSEQALLSGYRSYRETVSVACPTPQRSLDMVNPTLLEHKTRK
ncbi:unnamed protein product [Ostreobium quekettii]|uniref:Uncharacterized protein n=1 Tax=Ostreobium quekettii TaxID=121088 RepID=A0A8S1J258_9CHLO|nr:unnamed protein product [Ostreobium quekettii]